ncbi:MAG: alpha-amylase family glycosyl hydrolase [Anaerolineales bacterium]|nr:alpha-amylase family glycosyl hydrolase [Anaerolineales bacterium]
MEFHVSRRARHKYDFDQWIFTTNGNVIFSNFRAAREFAQKINAKRDLTRFPEQVIRAGQLNAMGLIDEILHLVVEKYRQQRRADVMEEALIFLESVIGRESLNASLAQFVAEFPPTDVYLNKISIEEYLARSTTYPSGVWSNRAVTLEEMLLLWLSNVNPAFEPFQELFDDRNLSQNTTYSQIIHHLSAFFEKQPTFGPEDQSLVAMLRSPAIAVPHSLPGQLEYIRKHWGYLLGDILKRLLSSLDLVKEEEKAIFPGSGIAPVLRFDNLEWELERFSPDREWMPRVVMMAKNTYVWLDQLSKKYRRPITRLDQIPDEELDQLSRWGFTALWLIGLWERSPASQRIKQLRGNPEAVASAYSLFDYRIAADLGGEEAFCNLRHRAWQRGIRLASDMVPNHMGIDSPWVINHPDWFISLDYSPFPSYTFNGPNLSWDQRVGIFLEDHYYNNTDAAVVFKRVDFWTGKELYIYHGNDGTSMPWNDTAQLNYLLPEVREQVIQTILQVARLFPIIRFDAAMTLAKRHYQRLWFPEPGTGGDIPSRAEHAMTREQFNAAFPNEFWREVVDRVAQEVPDTLLLAEAFWLMEGYFVRTLGMHRVYNSAFMNMLRDEKNQEYRLVIKNTLEFDPQILKRYVNFMNNPDERTAVDQFGKGDKYFGICVLLATLPGLPMFGHGQIEGFAEKYGMEYRRAYWDEQPDFDLITRHEQWIFPLLRKRYLFAEADHFLLYDFQTPQGHVNEDVFAYSNRTGSEKALIIYHNRYAETEGFIQHSCAYLQKNASGEKKLIRKSLVEGLEISDEENSFTIFRDSLTGLEFLRNNRELHQRGLYLELNAYRCFVFLDITTVRDTPDGIYRRLHDELQGRGVPSVEQAKVEMLLHPVRQSLREMMNAGQWNWLIQHRVCEFSEGAIGHVDGVVQEVNHKAAIFAQRVEIYLAKPVASNRYQTELTCLSRSLLSHLPYFPASPTVERLCQGDSYTWSILLGWMFLATLGKLEEADPQKASQLSWQWYREWKLETLLEEASQGMLLTEAEVQRVRIAVELLLKYLLRIDNANRFSEEDVLALWFSDGSLRQFVGVNHYQGVDWFVKEAFEEWLDLICITSVLSRICQRLDIEINFTSAVCELEPFLITLKQKAQESKYQLREFLRLCGVM